MDRGVACLSASRGPRGRAATPIQPPRLCTVRLSSPCVQRHTLAADWSTGWALLSPPSGKRTGTALGFRGDRYRTDSTAARCHASSSGGAGLPSVTPVAITPGSSVYRNIATRRRRLRTSLAPRASALVWAVQREAARAKRRTSVVGLRQKRRSASRCRDRGTHCGAGWRHIRRTSGRPGHRLGRECPTTGRLHPARHRTSAAALVRTRRKTAGPQVILSSEELCRCAGLPIEAEQRADTPVGLHCRVP